MTFFRAGRAIAIAAAGLVLLCGGSASGKECRKQATACWPTVEEHGPIADVPLSAPSVPAHAARLRQLRPGDLPEENVHLRLWVSFDGKVSDSLVSTSGALGPGFLDCAKRQASEWWLIPPQGGTGAFVDVNVTIPPVGLPRMQSRFRRS
jgi:hypothetical protein